MDNNLEIPEELYRRWKKVIDQEFWEIVEQPNEEVFWEDQYNDIPPQDNVAPREQGSTNKPPTTSSSNDTQLPAPTPLPVATSTMKPITLMTQDEEDELAKFLNFGMTVSEAREMKANEKRLAEVKLQIREQRCPTERGALRVQGT